jgi:endonuclease G, mitochondrial
MARPPIVPHQPGGAPAGGAPAKRPRRQKARRGLSFPQAFILALLLLGALWFANRRYHYMERAGEGLKASADRATETLKAKTASKKSKSSKGERQSPMGDDTDLSPDWDYDFTLAPGFAYPATLKGEQLVRHLGYTLSYNEPAEQASWVAYVLTPAHLAGKAHRDSEHFSADRDVSTGSAEPEDYRGSGYDRGHLAPAGDFKWQQEAMHQTFFMSNISPQRPGLNRGIWKDLEEKIRVWVRRDRKLYICTGPVLPRGAGAALPTIGQQGVAVPAAYYKVVLDVSKPQMKALAVLIPNQNEHTALADYVVTIDALEAETGLDFYPQLPDKLEKELESQTYTGAWGL